jgi:WD40 repeat protein
MVLSQAGEFIGQHGNPGFSLGTALPTLQAEVHGMNSKSTTLVLAGLAAWLSVSLPTVGQQSKDPPPPQVISPDGRLLALANDNAITISDITTRKELIRFQGHQGAVLALAWSPDGRALVSAARDKTVARWDTRIGLLLWKYASPQPIIRLEFSKDGRTLTLRDADMKPHLLDAATGKQLAQPQQ